MNCKRIGRTLICFLLVCVLLVNASPIRAEAAALGTAVAVGAGVVAISVLAGLGIAQGTDPSFYSQFVNDMTYSLQASGAILSNGLITLTALGNGRYGIPSHIIEDFKSWLDAVVLQYGPLKYPGVTLAGQVFTCDRPVIPYSYRYETYNAIFYHVGVVSDEPFQYIKANGTWGDANTMVLTDTGQTVYYFGYQGTYSSTNEHAAEISTYPLFNTSGVNSLHQPKYHLSRFLNSTAASSPYDLTLNFVANPGISLAEGYPAWAENAVAIDDEVYLPLAVAPTVDYMKDVKQEDVWVGVVFEAIEGGTEPSQPNDEENSFYPMDPNYTSLIERLFGNVSDKIEYVAHSIQEIPDLIREFALDVKKGFEELPSKFAEWFNDIRTKLQQLVNGQITLADLLAGLFEPIRNAIVDALTYLFAPRETFIKDQVETLIAKYPTSNNLFLLGTRLGDFLLNLGQKPPVIYIDLGAAEGSLLLGGTVAFLDLTWYARYKGTVDSILGAFLWLLFAWRVWLKLPGILGGASGTIGSILSRKEDFNDN